MPRPPFRNPGNRLPNTFSYEIADEVLLELLKPWNTNQYQCKAGSAAVNNRIRSIKVDIREKLLFIQDFYCAFCGIDLVIARKIQREHIAPQSQQSDYIFEPENMVLACFDCNDFKGRKTTIDVDTGIYLSSTFLILHPYRDDYGTFLIAHFENGGLFFQLRDGVTDVRATATLEKLGLQEPLLIKERGMRIRHAIDTPSQADNELIRLTCSIAIRKRN